ncbi:MAG: tRNA (N6-threonylcarbamoyladenosine(37)-N6)-methyltransferase TrmO [Anaerolineales bacterium]|nr:SAM-dependent methyltransferase [Anaerolineae bacterium]PWB74332.1 MAG: tRNA (N6-threonylcarbamoyladenosine(37)-N6)-methyltransferase TrmO [Anaerolineales bacterium]
MNNTFQINSIGSVRVVGKVYSIQVNKKFLPALTNIEGFSHLQVVWWAHLTDSPKERENFVLGKLFQRGPDRMGVFATRAPFRPNPILISTIKVQEIDFDKGIIYTPFIDAEDKTPILDIKPYFAMERVKNCRVPAWCAHWPQWFEDAMTFNWSAEIVNRELSN